MAARNDLTVKQGRAEKRKWRRKGLKRLIQRAEMVWRWKPSTHKI
jgi:hypothetical protein